MKIQNSECKSKIGQKVELSGWVQAVRDHGKIKFIDLRDSTGNIQAVILPNKEVYKTAEKIRPEWVISISGKVVERPEKLINKKQDLGSIEVDVDVIKVLSEAQTPPFEVDKDTSKVDEELRLKYRYLDLRSSRMAHNISLRHNLMQFVRAYYSKIGFREIETPYIGKSTPEGAREYIVPSRIYPGKFYSLPQSPQQFKQLLMVAGIEKYFQFARCFRDEDQRGDRQPEFTQLDLEMAFAEQKDVMKITEDCFIDMVKKITPEKKIQDIPFPILSYKEAMDKYGTDRPDLRKDKNDPNLLSFCWVIDFPFFEKGDNSKWTFTHNPFSRPIPEHMDWLLKKTHIGEILTTQYDLVLNGCEAAGGSIRNYQTEPLQKVFEIMEISEKEIKNKFGHMLEAFSYGAPPHGGIAWGFDRVVMILANEPNIREVIAFPKTGDARDPLMDAPSTIDQKQLKEAHIDLKLEDARSPKNK